MFEVGSIYSARDEYKREYHLFVLQLSKSPGALRGVVYDDSYKILSRRWFRVSISDGFPHDVYFCQSGFLRFSSKNLVDPSCYPPEEVLYYLCNDKF